MQNDIASIIVEDKCLDWVVDFCDTWQLHATYGFYVYVYEVFIFVNLCIVLFRISCNFLHYAPNSMHYFQNHSQDYCQTHCQNNTVSSEMILYCNTIHDYSIRVIQWNPLT